jgi:hypothetical protein
MSLLGEEFPNNAKKDPAAGGLFFMKKASLSSTGSGCFLKTGSKHASDVDKSSTD